MSMRSIARLSRLLRAAPPEVEEGLRALRDEFPCQERYIDSMLMTARFGRERDELGPDFVERVRLWCAQAERTRLRANDQPDGADFGGPGRG